MKLKMPAKNNSQVFSIDVITMTLMFTKNIKVLSCAKILKLVGENNVDLHKCKIAQCYGETSVIAP